MSANTWTVDVDGKRRTITVEHDAKTQRSTIRVDGRVVAKPLGPDETEREIPVGANRYVVRRLEGDKFDLDVPPEAFLNPTTAKLRARANQAPADGGGKARAGSIIGGIVVMLIVGALFRVGRQGFAYMRVPWKAYNAADGSFKVNFAGDPKSETQTMNINGDLWHIVSLESRHKNHFYVAQYVDVHMVVTEQSAPVALERFFDGWMASAEASVLSKETTSLSRNPALSFEARVPKGLVAEDDQTDVDARARGVITMHNKRMFLVFGVVPSGDRITADIDKFIESFEVPPPEVGRAARTTLDATPPPAEVATPAPVVVAPTPPPQSQEREPVEMAAPVSRVYAHNKTKTYYPPECAGRPDGAYLMAKSLAIRQGFTLAPACAK